MAGSDVLSTQAQHALVIAHTEAEKLGHAQIEAEHILLGVAGVPDSVGALSLRPHQLSLPRIRALVEARLPRGDRQHPSTPVLAESAKRVVAAATEIAKTRGNQYVRTEHLLEAVLEAGGEIGDVLKGLGLQTRDEAMAGASELSPADMVRDAISERPVATQELRSHIAQLGQIRRYNLALPEGLYQQVQQLAEREQTTVVEILRRFIRLGLLLDPVFQSPDASVIIREGDREREILMI